MDHLSQNSTVSCRRHLPFTVEKFPCLNNLIWMDTNVTKENSHCSVSWSDLAYGFMLCGGESKAGKKQPLHMLMSLASQSVKEN